MSLYMLFADNERGSEIYAAAGDRSQAGLVHDIGHGPFSHTFENFLIPELMYFHQ